MAVAKFFLIIDDDRYHLELFYEALLEVSPDCKCATAPNGRQAIMAPRNGEIELPTLIFLDINMPLMNGWQCLSILKTTEAYKNIPVIMYSTSSYRNDFAKAHLEGALCFFTKPSNFKELKNSLATVAHHMINGSLASLPQSTPLFC